MFGVNIYKKTPNTTSSNISNQTTVYLAIKTTTTAAATNPNINGLKQKQTKKTLI